MKPYAWYPINQKICSKHDFRKDVLVVRLRWLKSKPNDNYDAIRKNEILAYITLM